MQSVDPDRALKMYMEAGEWDKCLEVAKQQVSSPGPHPSVLRNIVSRVVSLKYYLTNIISQSITLSLRGLCCSIICLLSELLLHLSACAL